MDYPPNNLQVAKRRILLAHFAVVLVGAILFAVPSPNVVLAQNGERPPTLPHHESGPAQTKADTVAIGRASVAAPGVPLGSMPPTWTAAAPYPTTIARYAFAQVGQDFYVISGFANVILATVNRYNATTNVWTPRAPIPFGSEAPAAAYFKGKIYVADGGGGNLIRIYDIASNTWTAGPARPGYADSYGAAAGAFNGNVYVVGGSSVGPTRGTSIYNIASNTWSSGPDAPSDYQLGGYNQVGQFLYLIGTSTADTNNNSAVSMRLDMSTSTWSTGPAWTPRRADFALAASGSKLFAIGGDSNGGSFFDPSVQVDELETSSWPGGAWTSSPSNLPSVRQANQAGFFSTGRAGGEIWSTGGVIALHPLLTTSQHLFRRVPCIIAFTGAIGSNSATYPGSSGVQTNRVARLNNPSFCGATKAFPGTSPGSFAFDRYSFTNNGPPACVTFTIDTTCTMSQEIFAVAYLGSFNPANIAANYLGDIAFSPPAGHSFSVDVPANSTVNLVLSEVNSGGGCPGYAVTVNGLSCGFQLSSAVSRKTHGGTPFDIDLPLTGAPGVECRSGGAGGNHTIVFTFSNPVVSGSATVTTGTGTAGAATFSGNTMTVPLTGVADQQKITVTLNGVTDNSSHVLASTPVSMNVLLGDTTGNKIVNSTDVSQTKVQSGVAVSSANFRNDTNVSGNNARGFTNKKKPTPGAAWRGGGGGFFFGKGTLSPTKVFIKNPPPPHTQKPLPSCMNSNRKKNYFTFSPSPKRHPFFPNSRWHGSGSLRSKDNDDRWRNF